MGHETVGARMIVDKQIPEHVGYLDLGDVLVSRPENEQDASTTMCRAAVLGVVRQIERMRLTGS